jgi:predicted ATPase
METHLVGRQHEWKQIQLVWQNVITGRPQLLVLSGDAGIGKTRLAEELLRWVEHDGIPTATARRYANESELAYGPITSWLKTELIQTALPTLADVWLTEIARLVPGILTQRRDLPRPTPMTESWQRQHLFDALAHAVLHTVRQPLVLFLDDMQWCSSETLAWLRYLLRFDTQARLLLIGTMRSNEVTNKHPLQSFFTTLHREQQVTEIELEPLSVFETAALAKQVGGRDISSSQATLLHRETEGNPLFVVEMLRVNSSTARLPFTVQSIIADRLARLSTNALDVMSVASVIGRAFTFDVLAYVSKLEEEVLVLGLEELWQRRIVQELGEHEYSFTHDKLREGAYTAMSSARRCLLQHRVAEYNGPRNLALCHLARRKM